MAAAPQTNNRARAFSAKLKARLNRGTTWLDVGAARLRRAAARREHRRRARDAAPDGRRRRRRDDVARRRDARGAQAQSRHAGRRAVAARPRVGLLRTVEAPLAIAAAHEPFVILAVGVNGTGKTTTVGKLAHRLKAKGHSVLLAAADTFRAAAVGAAAGVGRARRRPGRRARARRRSRGRRSRRARRGARARHRRRARRHGGPAAYGGGAHGRAREDQARHQPFRRDGAARGAARARREPGPERARAGAEASTSASSVTGLAITKLDGTAKGGILLAIARQLKVPIRLVARRRRRRRISTISAPTSSCGRCSATPGHDPVRERPQALPERPRSALGRVVRAWSAASSCS